MVGLGLLEMLIILLVLALLTMLVAAGVIVAVLAFRKRPTTLEGTQALPGPRQASGRPPEG